MPFEDDWATDRLDEALLAHVHEQGYVTIDDLLATIQERIDHLWESDDLGYAEESGEYCTTPSGAAKVRALMSRPDGQA